MNVWKLIVWICAAGVPAFFLCWFSKLLRRKAAPWITVTVFAVKAVLLAVLGLLLVYWDSMLAWKFNMLTGGIYAAVFGSVITDLLRFATEIALRIVPEKKKDAGGSPGKNEKIRGWFRKYLNLRSGPAAEAAVIAAVILYGTINMMIVTPVYREVVSDKLENSYRIVFVSDVHTGSAQPYSVNEKMMEEIRKEDPDLLILGGDITDEYSTKEDAEYIWKLIGDTGIPAVFVWGNHDRQGSAELAGGVRYSEKEITDIIEKNGVTILADEYMTVGSDLILFGREDLICTGERKEIRPENNPSPDAFFLLLEHEQVSGSDLPSTGADLQLSGHSHAGQYFPLRLIYTLAEAYPSGSYRIGDSELITSDGASGWRIPFRTQNHCHYEVIVLRPAG